jgi:hypothetical protein
VFCRSKKYAGAFVSVVSWGWTWAIESRIVLCKLTSSSSFTSSVVGALYASVLDVARLGTSVVVIVDAGKGDPCLLDSGFWNKGDFETGTSSPSVGEMITTSLLPAPVQMESDWGFLDRKSEDLLAESVEVGPLWLPAVLLGFFPPTLDGLPVWRTVRDVLGNDNGLLPFLVVVMGAVGAEKALPCGEVWVTGVLGTLSVPSRADLFREGPSCASA